VLLSRAERWDELADILREAAQTEVQHFTELQTNLGDAYRTRLAKPELAVLRYRSVLQVDPAHAAAREGQHDLLSVAECRAIAVSSLSEAYRQTGEWRQELSLLETRLLTTESEEKRASLLTAAAREWETLGQEPARALECYRRALTLEPNDRDIEREVRRLAAQLDRWDVVVAAYRETIATFQQPTPRVAELRFEEAQTLELRLHDKHGALEAYAQAAAIVPQREPFASAAARVAAELQQWARAARELTLCAAAKGSMQDVPFERIDHAAEVAHAMQAYCEGLDACLSDTALELSASLRRGLLLYLAGLQRDKRNDLRAAEHAYERALVLDERDHESLVALCSTQRSLGSPALLGTLRSLAELERDNLDQLWEAAQLAHSSSEQHAVLDALYQRSAALWRRGRTPSGLRGTADACAFAIERTCQLYHAEGQPERALALLMDATRLPFDVAAHSRFMHEAAALALKLPGAASRAISLYQELLQREPADADSIHALASLYAQADRLPELLALRRHELQLDSKGQARLSLRLEIVRLLGEIEARGDRKSALHENLAEQPGHRASLDALSELLRARGQYAELTQVFEQQARTLTSHGHRGQAAWLWREIALLRERELSDPRAALLAYREVHELEPSSDASAALARLYTSLADHALAAEWLEIRLGSAPEELRAETAVALARAHLAAGQNVQARTCLEQTLVEHPQLSMAREMLAKLYREDSAWEPLALVLSQGADAQTEPERRLAYLREAADLYCDKLNMPECAIPVLERATQLAPEDSRLRSMLAEGLRVAGRYEEAKAVLRALVEGFGRKRSPERAEFHYQWARVAASARQFDEAFSELEQATKMDLGHQEALHMLASLAQQQGDLDRAERSYRALLLLLRRQKSDAPDALGQAQVLYELYRISEVRQQSASASELLASALEVASQSELEARRFSKVLRERGATDLLIRVLDKRLAAAKDPKVEAEILGEKAEVLEREQVAISAALDLRLRAVQLDDQNDALHAAALALAVRADGLTRYLDLLSKLADDAARSRAPKAASSQARHLLRLGRAVEREQRDFERAAALYAKVEASGEHTVEAWLGMARVAGARGDTTEQRRVLMRVSELPNNQASAGDRSAARFALAELELQEPSWRNQGVETLQQALNESQDYTRTKQVLTHALERAPEHTGLLALTERVARVSQDEPLLLHCIERAALLKGAQLDDVREGIEIALRRRDLTRAERLLERARTLYQANTSLTDDPTWVFSGLAQCRLQAKDTRGAMQYLREAVMHAPESESQALARELADLASGPEGDLNIAYETYSRLLEREPADRSLWEPALNVLMRLGQREELPNFVNRTLASLLMLEDRLYLLQAYASQLLLWNEDQAAADVLGQILEEEPAHLEATNQLLSIYEKHGMQAELMGLMQQQFDRARDERNASAIVDLGLRLGQLYAQTSEQLACDVLRAALDWQPESNALLKALLQHLPRETDARERSEIMMRLLRTESGPAAAQLSLDLAAHFEQHGDDDHLREALEQGYRAHPEQTGLRERLESYYAARELYRPMAELMELEAARLGPSVAAIACLRNAAAIYRDQVQDTDAAAGALRTALSLSPDDTQLLHELAQSLASAGQHSVAIEDVTRHLLSHPQPDDSRAGMLRLRAQLLSAAGQAVEALQDMEEAYGIAGIALGDELLVSLAEARDAARDTGAHAIVRSTSLRLVELLDAQGDPERARHELATLCEVYPDDIAALIRLRDRDMQEQRFEEAAQSSQRLLELTAGEPRVAAALSLAEAYDKLGQSEAALPWLSRVHAEAPEVMPLRERMRALYERTGEQRELAVLLMGDAEYHTDSAEKLACWQRAAEIFITLGDSESAIEPLQKATEVAPEDDRTRLLLIDIDLSLGRIDTAAEHIEQAMTSHKRRRSPELAQLQQRMARVSAARNDSESQLKWLNTALDTDRKSGEIASELVEAALACGDHETAMKALRTLTMMEDPRPITRAMAFLKQAEIAMDRGDVQRAQHWARKAKSLDESLQEADDLLAKLGG
jgi:tetratricopeptide (TPR) repeat protein